MRNKNNQNQKRALIAPALSLAAAFAALAFSIFTFISSSNNEKRINAVNACGEFYIGQNLRDANRIIYEEEAKGTILTKRKISDMDGDEKRLRRAWNMRDNYLNIMAMQYNEGMVDGDLFVECFKPVIADFCRRSHLFNVKLNSLSNLVKDRRVWGDLPGC